MLTFVFNMIFLGGQSCIVLPVRTTLLSGRSVGRVMSNSCDTKRRVPSAFSWGEIAPSKSVPTTTVSVTVFCSPPVNYFRIANVFKSCALVMPLMELKPNAGSDRAWVWNTHADFADEKPKAELLAIRFLNAESEYKLTWSPEQISRI